jgi:hypothetical protein
MGIFRKLIPGDEDILPFKIQVTITSPNTVFTLPLVDYGTFTPNISVGWGDGTTNAVISTNDSNRIHTYTNVGVYIITIIGFMPGWKVNNNSSIRNLITGIIDFGRVGLRTLDFFGCVNITTIPASSSMEIGYSGLSEMINFSGFMRGTGITVIPTDIFQSSSNAETFTDSFSFTSITTIPSGLFSQNTLASIFNSTFNGCQLLNSYPLNLFDNCPNVINFSSTFRNCRSLTQPLQFQFNTQVTTFSNIYNMTSTANSMSGTAPELWNRVPEPLGTAAFRNCIGLIDENGNNQFNDIPTNWK